MKSETALQPVRHHIGQPGRAHLVIHQKCHQLVDALGTGGDGGDGGVTSVFLCNMDPVVFAEELGGFLLVNGEEIMKAALSSNWVDAVACCNLDLHDIVSPSHQKT